MLDFSCPSQTQAIASPNRQYILQVVCTKQGEDDPTYALRLITPDKNRYESPLDEGAHELLWAPNSTAFFVDGGRSAYAGFFVAVYHIEPSTGIRKEVITGAAQRDMVERFPPCKAYNRDEETCRSITMHPAYNMSGLTWRDDSAAIYVFAEVPCSSSYGGIMCQVLGYELSVPDGKSWRDSQLNRQKSDGANTQRGIFMFRTHPSMGQPMSRGKFGVSRKLARLIMEPVFHAD